MLSTSEIVIRLLLACLFGASIGLERERKNWAAGMRTHMMVCVGSCLIMIVSSFGFSDILGHENVVLDPSRVAAQVVSGIGFIGAGTILFLKDGIIRGLTTAAGLWTVAAIGLATGGGMYFASIATTVIALIILWALQPLERLYTKRFKQRTLRIITSLDADGKHILDLLRSDPNFKIQSLVMERKSHEITFEIEFSNLEMEKMGNIIDMLKQESYVRGISFQE